MAKTLLRKMVYWETKLSLLLFKPQDWEIAKQFSLPRSMELIIAKSLLVLVFLEEPLMEIGPPVVRQPSLPVVRQPSLPVVRAPAALCHSKLKIRRTRIKIPIKLQQKHSIPNNLVVLTRMVILAIGGVILVVLKMDLSLIQAWPCFMELLLLQNMFLTLTKLIVCFVTWLQIAPNLHL